MVALRDGAEARDEEGLLDDASAEDALAEQRGEEIAMIFRESMTALSSVFPIGGRDVEAVRLHRPLTRRGAAPPAGCVFHTHCPRRRDRCDREVPPLAPLAPGAATPEAAGEVACRLYRAP